MAVTGLAAKVKSGVIVGGVTGDYPSNTNPLPGATATNDLPMLDAAMAVGSYEYWDSAGSRFTGTVADAGNITPSTSDRLVSTVGTVYSKVNALGDANLTPGNASRWTDLFFVPSLENLGNI